MSQRECACWDSSKLLTLNWGVFYQKRRIGVQFNKLLFGFQRVYSCINRCFERLPHFWRALSIKCLEKWRTEKPICPIWETPEVISTEQVKIDTYRLGCVTSKSWSLRIGISAKHSLRSIIPTLNWRLAHEALQSFQNAMTTVSDKLVEKKEKRGN